MRHHPIESKVSNALAAIQRALDAEKHTPVLASKREHAYSDKFALSESLCSLAVASCLELVERLGADRAALLGLAGTKKRVYLRVRSVETAKFLRKADREVPSATKVEKLSTTNTETQSTTYRTVTTVTEYFWEVAHEYEVLLFAGVSEEAAVSRVCLSGRAARTELVTRSDRAPSAERSAPAAAECDMSWLLAHLKPDRADISVRLDRNDSKCITPRRNPLVDEALAFFDGYKRCMNRMASLFDSAKRLSSLGASPDSEAPPPKLADPRQAHGFMPVLPLFEPQEEGSAGQEEAPAGAVIGPDVLNALLGEERRSMTEQLGHFALAYPEDSEGTLLASSEARLCWLATHAWHVADQYGQAVDYIEHMLREQLIAAVGREISPADFTAYLKFHHTKVYQPEHAPQPFCFAVRQPDRSPEGTVAIEAPVDGAPDQPIHTIVQHTAAHCAPMSFALDAATRVLFHGERYVHAFVDHQFAGSRAQPLTLAVRARQFSAFMVLLGRMGSGSTFEPTHGLIVRNKDELKIPLLLEQMPSAKEFADAIASLSPEQQRFAKAYRSMQLEGSVFGLLVLQLKPQLEKVLHLPTGALTKEIALTEKLIECFVEYQIPSDLHAFDGQAEAPAAEKLAAVKAHVQAIMDTLDEAKQEEVAAERQKHAFAHPESDGFGGGCFGGGGGGDCFGGCFGGGGGGDCFGGGGGSFVPNAAAFGAAPAPFGSPPGSAGGSEGFRAGGKGGAPGKGGGPMMRKACGASRGGGPPMARSLAAPPPMMAACAAPIPPPPGAAPPPPPPPAAPAPRPPPSQQQQQASPPPATTSQPATAEPGHVSTAASPAGPADKLDYSKLPVELDRRLAELDTDAAMRPTKIIVADTWRKKAQKALLASPADSVLQKAEQDTEKQKAFDLLDALSRAGSLPIDAASLHVILAATHCFDESLINTLVVRNVNPIEKLERSSLIVAETVKGVPATELVRPEAYESISKFSAPALLPPRSETGEAA